jgi:hypothetical protein
MGKIRYFVLPSSTYADPGLSPKERDSGLVWLNVRESSRNSFCRADNVKFRVFNEGSKSRGISERCTRSSNVRSNCGLKYEDARQLNLCDVSFVLLDADLKIPIPTVDQNSSDADDELKIVNMRPPSLTRLIRVNRRTVHLCPRI